MKNYYFGVKSKDKLGHHLYDRGLYPVSDSENICPFETYILDAGLLKNIPEIEGSGRICYIANWTIFTFWDRSGDKRFKSNSSFIVDKICGFGEIIKVSLITFPSIFERFSFKELTIRDSKVKSVKELNWEIVVDI